MLLRAVRLVMMIGMIGAADQQLGRYVYISLQA
jgi:hypothetical protein